MHPDLFPSRRSPSRRSLSGRFLSGRSAAVQDTAVQAPAFFRPAAVRFAAVVLVALAVAAPAVAKVASQDVRGAPPVPELPLQGLEQRPLSGMDIFSVRPGTDLSRYDRVLIDPIGLSVTRRHEDLALTERDAEHARSYFREKLEQEFGARALAAQPGPGVLRLSLLITEFVPNSPVFPERQDGRGGIIHRTYGVGEAAFQAVLTDAMTGEVVAVFADSDTGQPLGQNLHATTQYGDADRFIRRWAAQIASAVTGGSGQG